MTLPSAEELASAWTPRGKARTMLTEEIKEFRDDVLEAAAKVAVQLATQHRDAEDIGPAIRKLKEEP